MAISIDIDKSKVIDETFERSKLPDVQVTEPNSAIRLDSVGVKNVKVPIKIWQKDGEIQTTVASVQIGALVPSDKKGTHMSRLINIIQDLADTRINADIILKTLEKWIEPVETSRLTIKIEFPYFYKLKAPVSGLDGVLHANVQFVGGIEKELIEEKPVKTNHKFVLTVDVPIITCCPCSKEISAYNAHNQRAHAIATIDMTGNFIWIEDIISAGIKAGSSCPYAVLKRPDEKYVTEEMYENPKFVEDVAREFYKHLIEDLNVDPTSIMKIHAESEESIHLHNAYALMVSKEATLDETIMRLIQS